MTTLLIVSGIVIAILLGAVLTGSVSLIRRGFLSLGKWTYSFVGLYIVLGIVALLIVQKQETQEPVTAEALEEATEAAEMIQNMWLKADVTKLDPNYLKEQWTFPVEDDIVTIHYPNMNGDRVFVNYSSDLQGEMVLSYYETPYILYNLDFSQETFLPDVEYKENTLLVAFPQQEQQVYVKKISTDLTWLEPAGHFTHQIDFTRSQLLYLNVPQNVHIINESE